MNNYFHSFLFVPANEKMLSKIDDCFADAVIIDLEDAVLEKDKDCALKLTYEFTSHKHNKPIFVRINTNRINTEIPLLSKTNVVGFVVPKAESLETIKTIYDIDNSKQIIALVETPLGIINVPELSKSDMIYGIAFGAEDYTTKCNIHNLHENLLYQKSRIVNYCNAYEKLSIDTMSLNIRHKEEYQLEAQKTKDIGFNAKLAIHPMQVEIINELYSNMDYEYMKYVVDTYYKSGESVVEIDGKVYEKPHIAALENKLKDLEG